MSGPVPVKCVVWDIDNTLLTGVFLEAGDQPPAADPELAAVLAELGGRGILHALASRSDLPRLARAMLTSVPTERRNSSRVPPKDCRAACRWRRSA